MSNKWKQTSLDISLIDEASVNANQMSEHDFNRLVENIRISGGLSSAIACYRKSDTGRYVIISGHHRYRAAVKLRYREVPVIYAEESEMTPDEIVALQLSHNSLHGEDDKGILKRMFAEIQSVDFKSFAHVNIDELEPISTEGVSFSVVSEHYSCCVVFYRKDMELLDELVGIIGEQKAKNDIVMVVDGDENEDFYLQLIGQIRKKYEIKSSNMAFCKILELAKKQMESEVPE